ATRKTRRRRVAEARECRATGRATRASARLDDLDVALSAHDLDRAAVLSAQHVQVETRGADVQIADLERGQPRRHLRLAEHAAPLETVDLETEDRFEQEKRAARCPRLGPARDGVRHRRRVPSPAEPAEELRQSSVLELERGLDERAQQLENAIDP